MWFHDKQFSWPKSCITQGLAQLQKLKKNENAPLENIWPNCLFRRTNLLMMLWNYARSLVIENDAACPWTNLPFGKSNESLPHIPKHNLSSLKISFQFEQDCLEIRNPTIFNIICWLAGSMGQTTHRQSVWCSKHYFFS